MWMNPATMYITARMIPAMMIEVVSTLRIQFRKKMDIIGLSMSNFKFPNVKMNDLGSAIIPIIKLAKDLKGAL
jgi:hypothetical protein